MLNDSFALRLALFYGALFLVVGINLPFFPLWLEAKGLSAAAIGLALSLPHLVRVAAIPAATRLADRFGALRGALIVVAAGALAAHASLGLANSELAILVGIAIASLIFTPVVPLCDAYALKGLSIRGVPYGPVRLWGSAAFVLGNLGAGLAVGWMAAVDLIWLIVAALVLLSLAAVALGPVEVAPRAAEAPRKEVPHLIGSPAFLAVAIAVSLIQASHATYYGFSTLDWSRKGFDGMTIGALWAIGVVAEVVLFWLSGRLPAAFGPMTMIGIGAASAVLRWCAMALDPPALLLPLLQALHGLSFGATHLGTMQYLARVAPEGGRATAQGDVATIMGLGGAAALWISGILYGRYGSLAYAAMAAAAFAGGLVIWLAARLVRAAETKSGA
jgi:PPP family 3-phenylpropionic acid transporter